MWIPKKLNLHNFISHKSTTFEFTNGKAILIQGMNYDDSDQESNGSGKSVLIEGVSVALLGSPLKKVKMCDLILNGEEEAQVFFELWNTKTKQNLVITRKLFAKNEKASELEIIINDRKVNIVSVLDGNEKILELLGLEAQDIIDYFIISKKKYTSFFYASDVDKKQLIARFCKANLIDGIGELITEEVVKLDEELANLNDEILNKEGKVEVYEEQVEEIKQKSDKSQVIQGLKEQILVHEKRIVEWESGIHNCNKTKTQLENNKSKDLLKQKDLQEEINSLKQVNYDKEFSDIDIEQKEIVRIHNTIQGNLSSVQDDLHEFEVFLLETERNIKGSVKCPKCTHEFIVSDVEIDISEARKMLPEIKQNMKEKKNEINDKKRELLELDTSLKLFEDGKAKLQLIIDESNTKKNKLILSHQHYTQELNETTNQIQKHTYSIESFFEQVKTNKNSIENIKTEIEEVKKRQVGDDVKEIKEKITTLKKKLKELSYQHEKITQEKFDASQWIYNFKRFNTFLANKAIKSIEGFSNYYLQKMKTNLAIQLDGYKVLSDNKTIRERITTSVFRNGINEGLFDKFSEGEKGRIDFATILAMQKLISLNCKTGGLGLLFTDEITESIDSAGIENLMHSLNQLNQTVYVITHASGQSSYQNIVNVEKRNGFSYLLNGSKQ